MIHPPVKIKNIIFLVIMAAVFTFSCSKTRPEISFGFIQLVLYQENNEPVENFSFFIIVDDEDGIENLEDLYLYHDKEQLCWHIKSDEWITYTQDEKTWIGTRNITANEVNLPRGVFRAVLVNKGGEKGERSFTYDGDARFPFPEFSIKDSIYTINSKWPSNKLVCYNSSGNYVTTITIKEMTGPVSQLGLPSSVRTAALWSEDPSNFCSAFTKVTPTR